MIPFSNKPLQSLKISSIFLSYFSTLTVQNLHPHSVSLPEKFASYLDNCADTISLKKLHACVITRGLEQNTFLGSKLINAFARFNFLVESKWVFSKIINDDISLWNSIIIGYFRADQHNEVLGLYLKLRGGNIGIHTSAITFALKSCVELGTFECGRNLHTDAFKFGLNYDQFVGSSLIKFYTKCRRIGEASKVFDEIADRDVVSYTSMITAYAQVGDFHANKAFKTAGDMQRDGFEPNRVTLVSLLQCASRIRALQEGKSIHGYAIRRGIGSKDEVFETSVIDMYIKCGVPDSGTIIFHKTSKKTTGSWNALMAGYLHLGRTLEAFDLFLQMVNKCELDLIALANGLLICADLGYLLVGKTIHCHILREGVHLDLVGTTALINMYSKCNHLSAAMNIFHTTECKDDTLFNAMIAGYLHNGYVLRALELFQEMVITCIRPNTGTIISVLSAFSDMEDVRSCKCIHGYIFRQGLESNVDIGNQLINMYAQCGFIGCARQVFNRMKIKDRVTWTSMMTCLMNHGHADSATALFMLMQRENLRPDAVTFTCLLQALSQLGSANLVREVHARLYRLLLERDTTSTNSLITAYSKCGKLKTASDLFDHMDRKHLSSRNTMIAAYGMHGDFVGARKLMDQMKKDNIAPDGVTFKSILSGCSHNGLVEEGLHIFSSMEKEYGLVPSEEHYGCVVDLLGRAGRLEEAYELVKIVPSIQKASILGALLGACRIHGDSEMGERIGKWLLDLEPENASAYCSVSNLYAGRGRWDEVARIGGVAKGKGLRRIPGSSLVEFT